MLSVRNCLIILGIVMTAAACAAMIVVAAGASASAAPKSGGAAAPGGGPEGAEGTQSSTTTPVQSEPSSAPPVSELTLTQAVGQMLISHVSGLRASTSLLQRIRAGRVGSVILYGENISTPRQVASLTDSLQRAAREGHNPPVFIGTDQEGGTVKRLTDAPPWLSAAQMGLTSHVKSVAEAEGRAAGSALLKLGVNLDFAPVADVPTSANNFLGERAFGRSVHVVEEGVAGFARGLAEAHVAGGVKHFPGLGGAGPHNTDEEIVTIKLSRSQLRADYAPYRAVAKLGSTVAPLVMVSNAIYPGLGRSSLPADLSPTIVRNELTSIGLGGRVTVTDDLQVPAVERYQDAAVKAVRAGIDLLMFAQEEAASERAFSEIEEAVRNGALTRSEVMTAAERVVALKAALHLG